MGFGLSGNFSCEVTADAPLFSTATAVGIMQVVGKSKISNLTPLYQLSSDKNENLIEPCGMSFDILRSYDCLP